MASLDPQELLDHARRGDDEAWARLLAVCEPYLHVMAQRQLDSAVRMRVDPNDVVQQTCLEAHRDLGSFRGAATPELLAWLSRILENNVANLVRRHVLAQKRSVRREKSMDESGGRSANLKATLPSDVSSPSQRAMRGEAAIALAEALTRLPEDQRDAVRLRHLEGWKLARIAAQLQRSEVAVASLLKRGLQRLRGQLAEPPGERE